MDDWHGCFIKGCPKSNWQLADAEVLVERGLAWLLQGCCASDDQSADAELLLERGGESGRADSSSAAPSKFGRFLVDESGLRANEHAYYLTKDLRDQAEHERPAFCGDVLEGFDEGDGWLSVGEYYSPMESYGVSSLRPADSRCPRRPPRVSISFAVMTTRMPLPKAPCAPLDTEPQVPEVPVCCPPDRLCAAHLVVEPWFLRPSVGSWLQAAPRRASASGAWHAQEVKDHSPDTEHFWIGDDAELDSNAAEDEEAPLCYHQDGRCQFLQLSVGSWQQALPRRAPMLGEAAPATSPPTDAIAGTSSADAIAGAPSAASELWHRAPSVGTWLRSVPRGVPPRMSDQGGSEAWQALDPCSSELSRENADVGAKTALRPASLADIVPQAKASADLGLWQSMYSSGDPSCTPMSGSTDLGLSQSVYSAADSSCTPLSSTQGSTRLAQRQRSVCGVAQPIEHAESTPKPRQASGSDEHFEQFILSPIWQGPMQSQLW